MSGNKLIISDGSCESTDQPTVSLSEFKQTCTQEQYDEVFHFLEQLQRNDFSNSLQQNSVKSPPLLFIFWPSLVFHKKGGLIEAILFHQYLETRVRDVSPDELLCTIGSTRYREVVRDVAAKHELDVIWSHDARVNNSRIPKGFLRAIQIISVQLVWYLKSFLKPKQMADTIFFPYPGRFDSMTPVIEASKSLHMTITQSMSPISIPYFRETIDSTLAKRSTSIFQYSNLSVIVKEIYALLFAFRNLVTQRKFQKLLVGNIESKYGFQMEKSVNGACRRAILDNFRPVCHGLLSEELFQDVSCSKIVLGGLHPRERAILFFARKWDIDIFYIPHTVEIWNPQIPPCSANMFVSGELGKKHIERIYRRLDDLTLLPYGRPYLSEIYHTCDKEPAGAEDPSLEKIVIATQDNRNTYRERFLSTALDGIRIYRESHPDAEIEIVVKVHPSEGPEFYHEMLQERIESDTSNVRIVDNNLFKHIKTADILLTINSNVGLESMILGTPYVSINLWEPFLPTPPFAAYGPVPVLRDRQAVNGFFKQINNGELESMAKTQQQFVTENYELSETVASTIADCIE